MERNAAFVTSSVSGKQSSACVLLLASLVPDNVSNNSLAVSLFIVANNAF
jgi:hypothetical protein